ncbi:thioredoxin family protein [Alicyclobacillus mengziensis]|uniref:thioredoxin family protein n=1 Tax=Alicyclobacillus mengziensis TaxID=2931921 RepID=UPI002011FD09|nr:thioredoxin family protein [Alicyclobacillus mengziensis]
MRLAHQFAYESQSVTGVMVEASEFMELANKFSVYGVPKTVINDADDYSLEGAAPEHMLLERVTAAIQG